MPTGIPLTHFEELMLHQDSSAYPASCFIRLQFQGRLLRDVFESAATTAISRHPLLHSIVEKQRRKYVWQVGVVAPEITWIEGEGLPNDRIERLDITTKHGLHFHVRLWEDRSEVLIHFHHSCCDGIAIYQVVRDLLMAYAAKFSNEQDAQLPAIDEAQLKTRASTGRRGRKYLSLLFWQAARLPNVLSFFSRTPATLVPHRTVHDNGSAPHDFPALISHHFDKTTSAALKDKLQPGVLLNDLLTRDLFLAIRDFRKQQRTGKHNSWLRLMIPTNLRQPAQHRASAANMIGAVFLDRRASGMSDPDAMLREIRNEMDQIKRLELGHLFNLSLIAQGLVPGALKRAARPKRCCVTAVFTNIGRVLTRCPIPKVDGRLRAGNVVLLTTEAAAPITRNVCASFGVTWYAGRLTISLHYDSRALSSTAAEKMIDTFAKRIENSAGIRNAEIQAAAEVV